MAIPAIEELMVLLLEEKNQWLLPTLSDLRTEAEKAKEDDGERLEYILSRLFGQMSIPTGNTNYYHQLLDKIEYTKPEYRSFCAMKDYVSSYRTFAERKQQNEFQCLTDRKGHDMVYGAILGTKEAIYLNSLPVVKRPIRNCMVVLNHDGSRKMGLFFELNYADIQQRMLTKSFLDIQNIEIWDMDEPKIQHILLRELRQVEYYLFHKPLEENEDHPEYWDLHATLLYDTKTADSMEEGPAVGLYLPYESCTKKSCVKAQNVLDGLIMESWINRIEQVGTDL